MNKRTILILGLCFVLFMLWYPLMSRLGWLGRPQQAPPARVPSEAPAASPATSPTTPPSTPSTPPQLTSAPQTGPAPAMPWPAAERAAPGERTADLLRAGQIRFAVDTLSGGVTGAELLGFQTSDHRTHITLGDYRFPFCALELPAGMPPAAAAEVVKAAPDEIVLRRAFAGGKGEMRETWRLNPEDPYSIVYEVSLSISGEEPLRLDGLSLACGGMTSEPGGQQAKLARIGAIDLGVEVARDWKERPLALTARKIGKLSGGGTVCHVDTPAAWVAVHNKYFLMYVTPEQSAFTGTEAGVVTVGEGDATVTWLRGRCQVAPVEVKPGEPTVLRFHGYVGPKEHRRLRTLGPNVDGVMGLDLFMFPGLHMAWMGAISKAILYSLIWFAARLDGAWGFGYAIILITVIIKLLFWPLTHHSTVSMRRMQKLQPLIQEIKEKHKDDAATMNRKIWDLHREHKASPLGGCLPILLQIPIFFALFNTLRGAIELRQASFLWVSDLSQPDTVLSLGGLPIRPLAIVMGITMILQQYLSPSSGDPTQKRMMMFMSIFFLFLFYGMPSGLNLYWTVNQVLTIGQTLFTHYLEKRSEERKALAATAAGGARPARR